ncbi:hypothetical protein [Mycobacterium sp.]|uniref:hypothetical protein n=1 Tax=Mycobacterium sp. TaxID=1785 RepID=UPI002622C16C|nr:hypothetical protein [Mycobacterium sp.]
MKIRTTMLPDVELDVDAAEFTDLSRQGLLVDNSAPKRLPEGVELPADVLDPKGI